MPRKFIGGKQVSQYGLTRCIECHTELQLAHDSPAHIVAGFNRIGLPSMTEEFMWEHCKHLVCRKCTDEGNFKNDAYILIDDDAYSWEPGVGVGYGRWMKVFT